MANALEDDDCFMIGRALYSAATGDSRGAQDWIKAFARSTGGMNPSRRKAVLDGMLFEIFFNRDGQLRTGPKTGLLNVVFPLAKSPELRGSFEFIADLLVKTGKSFHAFPDLDSDIAVNVVTQADANGAVPAVTGVMIGGRNVLILDEPMYIGDNGPLVYAEMPENVFVDKLSREGVIASSRLVVHYPDLAARPQSVRFPYGHSIQWAR